MTRVQNFFDSLKVFRLLRFRDWAAIAAIIAFLLLLAASFLVVVLDASNARSEETRALEAQSRLAIDTRIAQSRRIDLLSAQISDLTQSNRELVSQVSHQDQLIHDLSSQVAQLGGKPVATKAGTFTPAPLSRPTSTTTTAKAKTAATSPTPTPVTTAAPLRKSATTSTSGSRSTPTPTPTPAPSPSKTSSQICVLGLCIP